MKVQFFGFQPKKGPKYQKWGCVHIHMYIIVGVGVVDVVDSRAGIGNTPERGILLHVGPKWKRMLRRVAKSKT